MQQGVVNEGHYEVSRRLKPEAIAYHATVSFECRFSDKFNRTIAAGTTAPTNTPPHLVGATLQVAI